MNNKIFILVAILVTPVLVFFGYDYYQQKQAKDLKIELESLKKVPESERCVVTIRGDRYDVTTFRSKHPGGNIFKCGEDMTDAFNKQHGESQLRKIQIYKIE